ncbi:MAG: Succinyl-CoA--L-malate CoA-transferase beta subunit [Pseudomonadota bacterium]|jgi:crotonobetainyl-CoA:carnitine CoA-transferase CaiB-like acyl-CoA transferase
MKALSDLRVLELGQLLAGPFAGSLFAGYGAEVIKVEPPVTGDPMRGWRKLHEGTSLWWYSLARNKKSVTLDLRKPQAADILKQLVAKCDVLIENFRPGRMEEWGLGYDVLSRDNPGLVMVRISGWGQTGPYAARPGFASVAEGVGGLRYIVGDPDRPPVRTGLSIGDSLAGLHAVIGALTALHHRERSGQGQVVDTAIYESVFNMMESMLPEFDRGGHVRERTGARLPGIVPSNSYRCGDGKFVIIGGNGDSIFQRLMRAVGRDDLATDPRVASNPGRVQHEAEIDAAIEAFTSTRPYAEVELALQQAEVPAGPIYSIADIASDPQYLAREMFHRVSLPDGTPLRVPAQVPKLSLTPGQTEWAGPTLGEHNDSIYRELLGLSTDQLAELVRAKVI